MVRDDVEGHAEQFADQSLRRGRGRARRSRAVAIVTSNLERR